MILTGILAILCWVLILPAIYMSGSLAGRHIEENEPVLRGIYILGFGFAILSYFFVALGTIGLLKPLPIILGLVTLCILGRRSFKDFLSWLGEAVRNIALPVPGVFGRIVQVVLWGVLAVTIVLCFLPEIAHDSLCYHLNLPKIFIRNTSVLPVKYDLKSFQSQFMEVLFALGLFLNNVAVAKLFHWVAGALVTGFLITKIKKETGNQSLAILLGLMLFLTPTFLNQVTVTYNDVAAAFFVLLAWAAFVNGFYESQKLGNFFVAGLLMGFAGSCKYLALMFGVPMGLWLFFTILMDPSKRMLALKAMGLFCLGAFLGCGYWFIRTWWIAGSPFYPIFFGAGGGAGLYGEQNYSTVGVPKTIFSFLTLPFSIVFSPDSFERHSWAGPFYLLLLPFSLWGAIRDRKARFAMWVCLISGLLWFLIAQNIRFLLPAFSLLIFAAACGIHDFNKLFSRPWITLAGKWIAMLNLMLLLGVGIYHYRVHLQALVQDWTADQFLTRLERTYLVAQWVNKKLPSNAVLYTDSEVRQFYFDRALIDAVSYYRVERYSDKLSAPELRERLRGLGITHIIRAFSAQGVPAGKPAGEIVDALLNDKQMAQLLYETQSQNIREAQYRYAIYELLPGDKV